MKKLFCGQMTESTSLVYLHQIPRQGPISTQKSVGKRRGSAGGCFTCAQDAGSEPVTPHASLDRKAVSLSSPTNSGQDANQNESPCSVVRDVDRPKDLVVDSDDDTSRLVTKETSLASQFPFESTDIQYRTACLSTPSQTESSLCCLGDTFDENSPELNDISISLDSSEQFLWLEDLRDGTQNTRLHESSRTGEVNRTREIISKETNIQMSSAIINDSNSVPSPRHAQRIASVHSHTETRRSRTEDCSQKTIPLDQHNMNPAEERTRKNTPECFTFRPDEAQDMLVMVQALSPVLERRKPARRSLSNPGISSSEGGGGVPLEVLQQLIANHMKENEGRKEIFPVTKLSEPKNNGFKKKETYTVKEGSSKQDSSNVKLKTTNSDLSQDLFISSKFARTWHGPLNSGTGRSAPRMGVAMVMSDSNSHWMGQPHTMPVISRTLLDAMHKRYCSHQYNSPWPPQVPMSLALQAIFADRSPSLNSRKMQTSAKLNSEGESDSGSSAPTSVQSSPRVPHSRGQHISSGSSSQGLLARTPSVKAQTIQYNHEVQVAIEIEAMEACQWLRAAGFPQYAQMFEDGQFPIDVSDVKKDHDFLDADSIQSLFRRLHTLNTCAGMKIETQRREKTTSDESDEEDHCALSDRWEYQNNIKRWSRKEPDVLEEVDKALLASSSHDSLLADQDSGSHTDDSPVLDSKMLHASSPTGQPPPFNNVPAPNHHSTFPSHKNSSNAPPVPASENQARPVFSISPKLHRAASERLKSALKRMDSFKKRSKKYPNRNIKEISSPVVTDEASMQAKLQHLNCVDITPVGLPSAKYSTPEKVISKSFSMDSPQELPSSVTSDMNASQISSAMDGKLVKVSIPKDQTDSSLNEYYTAHSQLLASFQSCGTPVGRNNSDTNLKEIFLLPQDHKPGSFPRLLHNGYIDTITVQHLSVSHEVGSPEQNSEVQALSHASNFNSSFRGKSMSPVCSRTSVYDNLPGTASPTHTASTPKNIRFGNRTPQVTVGSKPLDRKSKSLLRSLSVDSSDCELNAGEHKVSPQTCGLIRSQSTNTTRSKKNLFQGNNSVEYDHIGQESSEINPMDEFDMILQNLYDLSQAIGEHNNDRNLSNSHSVRHNEKIYNRNDHDVNQNQTIRNSGSGNNREITDDYSIPIKINKKKGDQITYNRSLWYDQVVGSTPTAHNSEPSSRREITDDYSIPHKFNKNKKPDKLPLQVVNDLDEKSFDDAESSPLPASDSELLEIGDEDNHTASSHESSDGDGLDELGALGARERRDSGVGSSLTRTSSSERKHKKIRWHSFQKSHRPSIGSRELQIGGLSVCQLLPLRQLSLLKLTAIMEKCSPTSRSQWSWSVPRFMKRNKSVQFSDKNVFGVPLTVIMQRTGQPLPQCILCAMRYLRRTANDAVGIFRKSGVRSRIQKLREDVEASPDTINFDELQPYDVADLLKQYFRELPECLLTNKLSDTFRSIFTYVPQSHRLEALQKAVILLPEENREVLHCLLLFLGDIAQQADLHQMTASNLAVCFAPSLFNLGGFRGPSGSISPRRQRKNPGVPDQRELLEQKAALECFTFMIIECKKLFMVPPSMYSRLQLSTLSNMEPVHLDEFYAKPHQPGPDFRSFGEEHIQIALKEAHDKNRGWIATSISFPGIEVMQRKPQDGHPLRQWKCTVEIEAPPVEVLHRLLHERHTWDDDLLSWSVLERLGKHSDIFHFVLNSMAPHPPRHFTVLRYWRSDLVKGACALVSRSVEHGGSRGRAMLEEQAVRAVELGSYYLMEPCGSGRSRLTYISRVDLRGRCPEWYNRVYGHMCAIFVERLQDSFRQEAGGPETKV